MEKTFMYVKILQHKFATTVSTFSILFTYKGEGIFILFSFKIFNFYSFSLFVFSFFSPHKIFESHKPQKVQCDYATARGGHVM